VWSEIITGPQEEHPWESECLLCLQRAMRKESSWEPSDHHKIWKDCKQIYDFTIWPRQRVCYSGVNILTNLTSNLCIHWIVRIHFLPVLAFSNCCKPPYKIKTKIKTSAWLTSLHSHAKSKIIQSFKFITKKKKDSPPQHTLSSIIPQYRNKCLSYKFMYAPWSSSILNMKMSEA